MQNITLTCAICQKDHPIDVYDYDGKDKKYVFAVCPDCLPNATKLQIDESLRKFCTKCRENPYHPIDEFYKINQGRYTTSYCKSCMKLITQARYNDKLKEDPTKVRAYSKQYYQDNKDKLREYQVNYLERKRKKTTSPPTQPEVSH